MTFGPFHFGCPKDFESSRHEFACSPLLRYRNKTAYLLFYALILPYLTDPSSWLSLHTLSTFLSRFFMQPAPSEAPKKATSVDQPRSLSGTLQHGSPDTPDPAPGRLPHGDDARKPNEDLEEADAVSVASSQSRRGRRVDAEWLSLSSRSNSSQEGSPGHRVEEYERAYATPRKPSAEAMFQVIPSKGTSGISIEKFPNGLYIPMLERPNNLIHHRGPDTHPVKSRSRDAFCHEPGVPTLPQAYHKPPCLENGFYSLLFRRCCPQFECWNCFYCRSCAAGSEI